MWVIVMLLCMCLGMVGAYACGCRNGRAEGYVQRLLEEECEAEKDDDI